MAPFALSLLFQLVPQKQYPSQRENWVIHTNRGSERAQRNHPEDKPLYFRVWQRKGKMDLKAGFPTKPAAKRGMKDTASCNKRLPGRMGNRSELILNTNMRAAEWDGYEICVINYLFNHSFIHSFTHAYITTSKTLIKEEEKTCTDSKNIVKMNIECVHIF